MTKRRKGKHTKGEQTVSGPFAPMFWRLRRLGQKHGLFVLFEGDPVAPKLTFFDTTRGVALINYWPKSRLWGHASRQWRGGRCNQHEDILDVAKRAAGLAQAGAN